MAIYSLNCRIIGRGQQKSDGTHSLRTVVAAAAYRSGSVLRNCQDGTSYDFTKKQGVIHSEILLPQAAPSRLHNRETLWNEVEALEKRQDAQFCRELIIAMPVELTHEQHIKLARSYVQRHFVDRGMCADIALHDPPPSHGGQRNPHVHILVTLRNLEHGKFGKKNRDWNQKVTLEGWREVWANVCNDWLERNGCADRIDHRSNKERGLGRKPTIHLGVEVTALERKGVRTEKGNINRSITAYNVAQDCGVENPSILSNVSKLWQRAFEQRRTQGQASVPGPEIPDGREPPGEGDTQRSGVQRRTYTLLRNVVRQDGGPAPDKEETDALRGDENASGAKKSVAQQGQEDGPSGGVLRQPAQETGEVRRSSVYDIKVMASTLNFMAEQGVGNERQLEEKISALSLRAAAMEDKLTGAKGELSRVRRLMGVASAGASAQREAGRLRGELSQMEHLRGAVLRVQANRHYAEEYQGKTLFRENYYKKFGDKIDAYHRAVAELKAAGLDAEVTPEQMQEISKELTGKLKHSHQKYLWAEHELKAAGFEIGDGRLQARANELASYIKAVGQELYELRGELWKWQCARDTIHNVQEGKDPRAGQKEKGRDGKQQTPRRKDRER